MKDKRMIKAAVTAAAVLALVLVVIAVPAWCLIRWEFSDFSLDGPTSPEGLRVRVNARVEDDNGPFNAGFSCNIQISDESRSYVFEWRDKESQRERSDIHSIVQSMRWKGPRELEFNLPQGSAVRLEMQDDGSWSLRYPVQSK